MVAGKNKRANTMKQHNKQTAKSWKIAACVCFFPRYWSLMTTIVSDESHRSDDRMSCKTGMQIKNYLSTPYKLMRQREKTTHNNRIYEWQNKTKIKMRKKELKLTSHNNLRRLGHPLSNENRLILDSYIRWCYEFVRIASFSSSSSSSWNNKIFYAFAYAYYT